MLWCGFVGRVTCCQWPDGELERLPQSHDQELYISMKNIRLWSRACVPKYNIYIFFFFEFSIDRYDPVCWYGVQNMERIMSRLKLRALFYDQSSSVVKMFALGARRRRCRWNCVRYWKSARPPFVNAHATSSSNRRHVEGIESFIKYLVTVYILRVFVIYCVPWIIANDLQLFENNKRR